MKKMKYILSFIISAIMVLSVSMMGASAESYTITVKDTNETVSIEGVTYTAYKVFSVSYNSTATAFSYTTDSTCLSETGYTDAYTPDTINTAQAAREFGDYVYNTYINGKTVADTVDTGSAVAVDETAVITVPSAGYYIIMGTGNADNNVSVTSLVMLDTTKPDAEVNTKLDAPTIGKKIKNNDDDSWGFVGDNQIGDSVEFKLESRVPLLNGYTGDYKYIIHDTMSSGLSYEENSLSVKINDTQELDAKYYAVTADAKGQNIEVSFDIDTAVSDGVISADDILHTYYSALLNTSAMVAENAPDTINFNENAAYLEYSNNPYDMSMTGSTTTTKVYDWSYAFTIEKVDRYGDFIKGAGFTVTDDEGNKLKFTKAEGENYIVDPNGTIEEIVTTESGTFKLLGLDDITVYTLEETTVPEGYKKCKNVTIQIGAEHDESAGNQLVTLTGKITDAENETGLKATIKNISSAVLVGTGGIGTRIFYISGGAIMTGAAALFVTKKCLGKKNA